VNESALVELGIFRGPQTGKALASQGLGNDDTLSSGKGPLERGLGSLADRNAEGAGGCLVTGLAREVARLPMALVFVSARRTPPTVGTRVS
jgi:hypothetical protein